jgi:hypothetical protein
VYVREIVIPKGAYCIGRIHKYAHVSIMVSGELMMWTEFDGMIHLKGYNRVLAPPGIKRLGYVLEDVRWITAHGLTKTMHRATMVDSLTVASYAGYRKFLGEIPALSPANDTSTLSRYALAESGLPDAP